MKAHDLAKLLSTYPNEEVLVFGPYGSMLFSVDTVRAIKAIDTNTEYLFFRKDENHSEEEGVNAILIH